MSLTKATRGSNSVFAGGENGGSVCQSVVGVYALRLVELIMLAGLAYKHIGFLVNIDHLLAIRAAVLLISLLLLGHKLESICQP